MCAPRQAYTRITGSPTYCCLWWSTLLKLINCQLTVGKFSSVWYRLGDIASKRCTNGGKNSKACLFTFMSHLERSAYSAFHRLVPVSKSCTSKIEVKCRAYWAGKFKGTIRRNSVYEFFSGLRGDRARGSIRGAPAGRLGSLVRGIGPPRADHIRAVHGNRPCCWCVNIRICFCSILR